MFLKAEDFGLVKESNDDDSELTVSFMGTFSSDESQNTEIELRDSSGTLIDVVRVSSARAFAFNDLDPDKLYSIHTPGGEDFGTVEIINIKSQAALILSDNGKGVYTLPRASSVYKLNIASGSPKTQEFIIRDKVTGKVDTLWSNDNGDLTVKPEFIDHDYELSVVESTLPPNAKVQVFDHQNRLIYEAGSNDDRTFIVKFLDQEDYALAQEENSDFSMLNFGLNGAFQTNVSAKSRVELFSKEEAKLAETYTGTDMTFVLNKIPSEQKFILKAGFNDPNAILEIENSQTGKKQTFPRENNGDFIIDFEDGSEQLRLKKGEKEVKVSEGAKFDLSEVYYDFNSYRLKQESRDYLNELVSLLKENPNVKVQIRSHTDSRGPSNYNKLLSQKRADAVIEYLESKGITADRLESIGLGETELTNKCADGVPCTNAEHARNRRTEFVILKGNS
jgi:outer membrane protein OmpA-like peptidoglycan-associated protein